MLEGPRPCTFFSLENLDTTKPRYSDHLLPDAWPFVISRFHCKTKLSDAALDPSSLVSAGPVRFHNPIQEFNFKNVNFSEFSGLPEFFGGKQVSCPANILPLIN